MNTIRQQGVRIPENQSTEQAPVMTVTKISRMEMVLLEFGNERGIKETTVAYRLGDKVFVPPNYLDYTSKFKPLSSELTKQVIERLEVAASQDPKAPPQTVPTSDAVDVMSPGGIGQ